ncbi:MAG: hypothetical protein WBP33_11985 [Saprospiraceae bacterium]
MKMVLPVDQASTWSVVIMVIYVNADLYNKAATAYRQRVGAVIYTSKKIILSMEDSAV